MNRPTYDEYQKAFSEGFRYIENWREVMRVGMLAMDKILEEDKLAGGDDDK